MDESNGVNGQPPEGAGRFVFVADTDDRLHVRVSGGLPLDVAERMLYGALKSIERELATLRLVKLLDDQPRVQRP